MIVARFNYPKAFVTLPEYTTHAGQLVWVGKKLGEEQRDDEVGDIYYVLADDGWTGEAFEFELEIIPEPS